MRSRTVISPAPSIRADSSKLSGIWAIEVFMMMMLNTLMAPGSSMAAYVSMSPSF